MIREDYLLRLIRQLVDALARIAGLRERGDHARARQELGHAWQDLIDVPRELVEATDPQTLASLLHEPAKVRAAAQLLAEEARVMTASGDPLNAGILRERAVELYRCAHATEPQADDDDAILALLRP